MFQGHETVGVVAAIGKDVKGFEVGERVVADNSEARYRLVLTETLRRADYCSSATSASTAGKQAFV